MSTAFSGILYQTIQNESDNDADTESDNTEGTLSHLSSKERITSERVEPEDAEEEKSSNRGGLCSLWHATWNLVNMIEGTGMLGLPYAVKEGGIVVIFGLIFLGMVSNYTGQVLINCLYKTSKEFTANEESDAELTLNAAENKEKSLKNRVRSTYEDVGETCFPQFGGKVVVTVQIIELMSVSTLYLVLCGSLLVNTFPRLPISQRGWIAIGAALVLPSVFLKSLAHVAWLSLLSTVALMATVTAVIWYGISVHSKWDLNYITVCNVSTTPVGIGIVLFSYAAHPLLPGIEQSMKDKTKFPLIMNVSFIFAAITKVLFSVTAFLAFSDKTQEVITNNLPPGAIRTTACILLVINVLFSYAFPMFTVIQCVTDSIVSKCCFRDPSTILFSTSLRIWLVVFTMLAALVIPHFALLMSFIGNFTGTCLVFVFPVVFHLKLRTGELKKWQVGLDILILLFGTFAGVVGVLYSGIALVKAYINEN